MNVYNRVAHPEPGNEVCNEKSVKDMETQILSRRGYTLNGVLGEGTYSKVKVTRFSCSYLITVFKVRSIKQIKFKSFSKSLKVLNIPKELSHST